MRGWVTTVGKHGNQKRKILNKAGDLADLKKPGKDRTHGRRMKKKLLALCHVYGYQE